MHFSRERKLSRILKCVVVARILLRLVFAVAPELVIVRLHFGRTGECDIAGGLENSPANLQAGYISFAEHRLHFQ